MFGHWLTATKGNVPALNDVTRQDVERFLVAIRVAGKEPATRHMRYRGLRRFFGWLAKEGEIAASSARWCGSAGPGSGLTEGIQRGRSAAASGDLPGGAKLHLPARPRPAALPDRHRLQEGRGVLDADRRRFPQPARPLGLGRRQEQASSGQFRRQGHGRDRPLTPDPRVAPQGRRQPVAVDRNARPSRRRWHLQCRPLPSARGGVEGRLHPPVPPLEPPRLLSTASSRGRTAAMSARKMRLTLSVVASSSAEFSGCSSKSHSSPDGTTSTRLREGDLVPSVIHRLCGRPPPWNHRRFRPPASAISEQPEGLLSVLAHDGPIEMFIALLVFLASVMAPVADQFSGSGQGL